MYFWVNIKFIWKLFESELEYQSNSFQIRFLSFIRLFKADCYWRGRGCYDCYVVPTEIN